MTSRNENCNSSDSDERSVLTPETDPPCPEMVCRAEQTPGGRARAPFSERKGFSRILAPYGGGEGSGFQER